MNLALFKKVLKNPSILYILIKYGIFVVSFFNSVLIAVKMGAFYLGIWGFINLVIGYMAYASLGVPNSMNVLISRAKKDQSYARNIFYNANGLILIVMTILISLYIITSYLGIHIGDKYSFSEYALPVLGIVVFNIFNGNISILLRIYNKVNLISITQAFYPVLTLLAVFIFDKSILLNALIYTLLISNILTAFLYILASPFTVRIRFELDVMKTIQMKGIFLFVYNTAFYCIMLSTKSFISNNYAVEEFGYFTFSFSFANAVLLLMNTLSFLIFPKMIAVLSSPDNQVVTAFLSKIRTNYIVFSHLLIHAAIFLFPYFLDFFPQYAGALRSFQLIGLTLIMYNNAFGYQGLLMARDEEKKLSILSVSALVLNIVLAYILTNIVAVSFSYVILSTLLTYFFYVIALTYYGRKSLQLDRSFRETVKEAHQLSVFVPYVVSLGLILTGASHLLFVMPLLLLIFLNRADMKRIALDVKRLLVNPTVLNI